MRSLAQQICEGDGDAYVYFLNDLEAEAPKSARRFAELVAERQKVSVRKVLGGFVPEWTKKKVDIATFFGGANKTARKSNGDNMAADDMGLSKVGSAAKSERKSDMNKGATNEISGKNGEVPKPKPVVKKAASSLPSSKSLKVRTSPIRKKEIGKKRSKSIADYFQVQVGKEKPA